MSSSDNQSEWANNKSPSACEPPDSAANTRVESAENFSSCDRAPAAASDSNKCRERSGSAELFNTLVQSGFFTAEHVKFAGEHPELRCVGLKASPTAAEPDQPSRNAGDLSGARLVGIINRGIDVKPQLDTPFG